MKPTIWYGSDDHMACGLDCENTGVETPVPGRDAYVEKSDYDDLLARVERYEAALIRIKTIRSLPLTDIHDTDEEVARQYSSVISSLAHIASKALTLNSDTND